MADSIGLSDVSSPDTGKGSQLKTGGGRRKHNMARECVEKLMKKGMSADEANKKCYPKGKMKKETKKKLKMADYAGTGKRTRKDGSWGY